MPLVRAEEWVPIGVESLEPMAIDVVRSDHNTLVVAGPGAGKTELLAQRACFLLETGTCPAFRRILAISFKRDAAKNLADRVRQRCGDRARRFDSFTLDAFAKSFVDRFMPGLPDVWRPKVGYEVMTQSLPIEAMRRWIGEAGVPAGHPPLKVHALSDGETKRIFDRLSHGLPLPYEGEEIKPLARHLGLRWWRERLALPPGKPSLTFPMLNRLAAFLLRCNPKLAVALRATYAFVFLDEFQDTTVAQYALVRSAFQESDSILTAVGDSKQRIMVWAGAMTEIFDVYENDFQATRHHLVRNYRSAPELVRMQHIIAQAIEAGTTPAEAVKADIAGSCNLLEFKNPEEEAEYLANLIDAGIRTEGKKLRDFCILVRQRTSMMIKKLKEALMERNIRLRDESQLQDLLVDPVVKFLLAVLRLATRPRDAEAWEFLMSEIAFLLGLDESEDSIKIEQEAGRLLQHARGALKGGQAISNLPSELVEMLGDATFKSSYRQYRGGSYFKDTIDGLSQVLQGALDTTGNSKGAVDDVIGIDVVPAMTIHKSKGLEFDTVIFLGLEDSQWWNFSNESEEEKRGFFVAFSRAAEHVFFTFSDVRDERWGRKQQRKAQIGDLYSILQRAGVPTIDCRG
jgi:DNA helicase II / ATP-dependent DNA helicase PcrA